MSATGTNPSETTPHRSMRILLVDDDVDSTELITEILRSAGHEVHVAADPDEALLEIKDFQPELAIIDIGLPIMDGYELARQIRAVAKCALIALSGYAAGTAPTDTRVTSFDHHLMKPLDCAALMRLIAALP
jgi:DNA-binding response OmpR family regulator